MIAIGAPLWLAALGALAVPLAIHLWSHRPHHPIQVGSIRLLSGMPPAAARALRLRDPWRLLLRLALLAALALALADPYWTPRAARPGTWALLSDEALSDATLVDSLRDAGADLRFLDDGSPLTGDDGTESTAEPPPSAIGDPPNTWSLLADADRLAPAGTRFVVAAPLSADRFRGPRPALARTVTWREVPARAAPVSPPAVSSRRVALLADRARTDDARYLDAAIRAAAQATGIPVEVRRGSAADTALARGADWIVWLTAGPPTARPDAPVWIDATGTPLLTLARDGPALAYRFPTPLTTERTLGPGFAEAVATLWAGPIPAAAPRITPAQATPTLAVVPARRAPPAGGVHLAGPLWMLAALAFGLDRALAWRRPREAR